MSFLTRALLPNFACGLLVMAGCGAESNSSYKTPNVAAETIGKPIDSISTGQVTKLDAATNFSLVDATTNSVITFDTEPFQMRRRIQLNEKEQIQGVITDPSGAFDIVITGDRVLIVDAAGQIIPAAEQPAGNVQSFLFDHQTRTLALIDEFDSFLFVVLDNQGQSTATWRAGNLLEDRFIVGGLATEDGNAVFQLSDNSLMLVDLGTLGATESFAGAYDIFPLGSANPITYLGLAEKGVVVIEAGNGLLFDTTTKLVTPLDFPGQKVLHRGRDFYAHLITQDQNGETYIYYYKTGVGMVSEKIRQKNITAVSNTIIDPLTDTLVVVYQQWNSKGVLEKKKSYGSD